MRQCSFEKLARFEMAVFEFARGYTNSYRRPTSPFCLTNGQLLLAFFYLCSTLTSDTLNLASGNLDTLGCLGVSNLPAVDFRVDYRLRAFSSS